MNNIASIILRIKNEEFWLGRFMKALKLQNYAHQIEHAKGTNYNKSSAGEEMGNLWNSLPDDLKESISYIKGDREKLIKYFS